MNEKQWDKKYTWLFLENEIYYNKEDMTTYLILTPKELQELKKKTLKRMMLLDNGNWIEEDFEKLRR